jgi:hypothetical protein
MKMSYLSYVELMVRQEHHKDLLYQAQQERMVKLLKPRPGRYRAIARWIGAQVMNWSSTLQQKAATHLLRRALQLWVSSKFRFHY